MSLTCDNMCKQVTAQLVTNFQAGDKQLVIFFQVGRQDPSRIPLSSWIRILYDNPFKWVTQLKMFDGKLG